MLQCRLRPHWGRSLHIAFARMHLSLNRSKHTDRWWLSVTSLLDPMCQNRQHYNIQMLMRLLLPLFVPIKTFLTTPAVVVCRLGPQSVPNSFRVVLAQNLLLWKWTMISFQQWIEVKLLREFYEISALPLTWLIMPSELSHPSYCQSRAPSDGLPPS